MFNPANAPVTLVELQQFARRCLDHLDLHARPGRQAMTFVVPAGPDLRTVSTRDAVDATFERAANRLLKPPTRLAAAVSVVGWGPIDEPAAASWLVVVVGRGLPACFLVRRVDEDDWWTAVANDEVPWTALATASGIRAALEQGEPMRLKSTSDPSLLRPPSDEPDPPVDEHGEL